MKMSWSGAVLSACVLGLTAGAARAEEAWKTVAEKPYVVKVRARPGSEAKDVWAEGELAASAADVQAVLRDVDAYRRWMPYVKESRILKDLPDEGQLTYTKLDLPVVSSRDYICNVVLESRLAEDGSGVFAQRWQATPDAIPQRRGTVRIRLNEEAGAWSLEAKGSPMLCTASPWTRPAPFLASWRVWDRRTPWRTRSARWRSAPGSTPHPGHERNDAGAPQPMQGPGRGAQALRVFRAVAPRTARHAS